MSRLGEIYKQAHEIVLNRYATEKDNLGRSQKWKIELLNEDKKNNRDSGLIQRYINEVEATVDKILSEQHTSEGVSAEPLAPAKPHYDFNPS
jgi:hypothetical protein